MQRVAEFEHTIAVAIKAIGVTRMAAGGDGIARPSALTRMEIRAIC
jgi:hypothetical protein